MPTRPSTVAQANDDYDKAKETEQHCDHDGNGNQNAGTTESSCTTVIYDDIHNYFIILAKLKHELRNENEFKWVKCIIRMTMMVMMMMI